MTGEAAFFLNQVTSTVWQAVIIVGTTSVLGLLGFLVIIKFFPHFRKDNENELTEFIFGLIGGLYGLLLAFVVVIVWQNFSDAQRDTKVEVARIENLMESASSFRPRYGEPFKKALIAYTDSVANNEWKDMADTSNGNFTNPETGKRYQEVRQAFRDIRIFGDEQIEVFSDMGDVMNDLGESRRLRLLDASATLPTPLWLLILLGGAISIGFTYLYLEHSWKKHAFLTTVLAAVLGFVFFLVYAMQYPFSGDISTPPDAFRAVVREYKQYKPAHPVYSNRRRQ